MAKQNRPFKLTIKKILLDRVTRRIEQRKKNFISTCDKHCECYMYAVPIQNLYSKAPGCRALSVSPPYSTQTHSRLPINSAMLYKIIPKNQPPNSITKKQQDITNKHLISSYSMRRLNSDT